MRKKLAIALVGTVAALTLGSLAWAAIPGGNGVISGCYDKATGALRVTDPATNTPKGCSAKEAPLTWSQQGPKGDKGDPGPSHVWGTAGSAEITATSDYGTQVAQLTLPGCALICYGDSEAYLVSAKLVASAVGPNVAPEVVRCQLHIEHASGSENDYAEGTVSSNASGDVLVSTLTMEYPVRTSGGTATVYCDAPKPAYASNVKLLAVHVGGVN